MLRLVRCAPFRILEMVKLAKAMPPLPVVRPPACHTVLYRGIPDLFAALWSASGILHQGITDIVRYTF